MNDNWYGFIMAVMAVGSGVMVGLMLDQAYTLIARRRYKKRINK